MGQADWNLPYEKLDCPVLVVTGHNDRIFYDKEVIEELSARIPKVQKIEIPDAAHMIPAECGPEFSDVLLDFCKIPETLMAEPELKSRLAFWA